MLSQTSIFRDFDIVFLSELTFLLRNETFAIDDRICDEGETGATIYFITKGNITLLHKETHSFIKELEVDEFFGEFGFFSD